MNDALRMSKPTLLLRNKMAAPCRKLARSVMFKGLCQIPGRSLWTQRCPVKLQALRCIPPRCLARLSRPLTTTRSTLISTKTEQPRSTDQQKTTDTQKEQEKETEEEEEGPVYIPTRKAKNPMMKIGYAWMIGLPAGIIGFILTKREVDKNRLKQLRIRQRMNRSNEGEYEGSRYRNNRLD
ncbi:uncharacterized protein [Salmo salar]|uniref:Uncharacterized protein n=1 Tax=Salmo salar TaxID=8030 RepID=A0ABM3EIB5_SALSA|nr:DUF4748 domain-containing protein [Salmo salar]